MNEEVCCTLGEGLRGAKSTLCPLHHCLASHGVINLLASDHVQGMAVLSTWRQFSLVP